MVKIISPQYVKPFVCHQKNDGNDAAAICTATRQPHMRLVRRKTIEQQDIRTLHRARQRLGNHRTAVVSPMRGMLLDRGIASGVLHLGAPVWVTPDRCLQLTHANQSQFCLPGPPPSADPACDAASRAHRRLGSRGSASSTPSRLLRPEAYAGAKLMRREVACIGTCPLKRRSLTGPAWPLTRAIASRATPASASRANTSASSRPLVPIRPQHRIRPTVPNRSRSTMRVEAPDALLRVDPVQHQRCLIGGAQVVRHQSPDRTGSHSSMSSSSKTTSGTA